MIATGGTDTLPMPPAYRAVVFDCDSTLSEVEGIDELAAGEHADAVRALTDAAMRGEVPLEEVYGRRLALVRPGRRELERLGALYVERLVPDAAAAVAVLLAEGIAVRIVSGGLRPAVLAVARALGIADADVAAVDVWFDDAGRYAGFDESSPLARSDGKARVIAEWRDLPRPVMLVGDGATDLAARPVIDAFVAFAGVVERPEVCAMADFVVRSPSLLPVLPLALGDRSSDDPGARAGGERGDTPQVTTM